MKVLTPQGLSTSPDSLIYLEMASSFQEGAGAMLLDRAIDLHEQRVYEPVTIWPPLYSAFLATVIPDVPDVRNVQYVSSVFLAVTVAIIFLLLTRILSWKAALLLCMLYCATVPVLLDYSFVWSETLFLPLYCGALWAIVKYLEQGLDNPRSRGGYLLLLGVLILAMFCTRYSGASVSLLLVYVFLVSKNKRVDMPYFVASGLLFSIPMVYLMYTNYLVADSVTGGYRPPSALSISDNLEHVRSTVAIVFPTDPVIWLGCIVLSALLGYIFSRVTVHGATSESGRAESGMIVFQVSLFMAVFYIVSIVILRSVKFFDEIGIRLISPAFPAFWVFLCAAAFIKLRPAFVRLIAAIGGFAIITALCFQGYLLYNHIRGSITAGVNPEYPYRSDNSHENFTYHKYNGELPRLIADKFPNLHLMASKRPQRLEFVTGGVGRLFTR